MSELKEKLSSLLIGQSEAVETMANFVEMYQAGFNPEGRPAGVVMLLGPTGCGKTHSVEALAEVLHGSRKNILKIDCAEFQLDHEVAKLVGAPPGYLGHRETDPALCQRRVNAVASTDCKLSLVLFDEIEKAAPPLARLLLGLFDKGIITLGDNTKVFFENCLVFMTSNLGAKAMARAIKPDFGLEAFVPPSVNISDLKAKNISKIATKGKFLPEFINRVDEFITYKPLGIDDLEIIIEHIIQEFSILVNGRLNKRGFSVNISKAAKKAILDIGTSTEFGARELKRAIQKKYIRPLSILFNNGKVPPCSDILFDFKKDFVIKVS